MKTYLKKRDKSRRSHSDQRGWRKIKASRRESFTIVPEDNSLRQKLRPTKTTYTAGTKATTFGTPPSSNDESV